MTGILKKPDCTRSDALQSKIQLLMKDVFGSDHMGYVEPTDDPFADSHSESSFEDLATADQSEDAFSDTDYSELECLEISEMESANDDSAA